MIDEDLLTIDPKIENLLTYIYIIKLLKKLSRKIFKFTL